jgi:hypothetical protein
VTMIPKKVHIGPYTYTIDSSPEAIKWAEKREEDGMLDGYISMRLQRIALSVLDCDMNNVRYSLLHEIVHGLLDTTGYASEWLAESDGEVYEEGFTARFSSALLDVLRRNPSVTKFLVAE